MGSCFSCGFRSVEHVGPPPVILDFFRHVKQFFTEEGHLKGVQFQPDPTDVIICTPSKCGTTWVQQICHGLRSGGDMSFDEICLVIPCLEMAHDYGYKDLQAPQPFTPRMYKSHLWYPACPKGAAKYIVIFRQPSDAALSFYHFLLNWKFTAEEMSPDVFIEWFFLKMGAPKCDSDMAGQFHHMASWYPHRLDKNVLWLHYEDLKQDLRGCVRLIADFLDIGSGDEKLQELVTHQASFEFMKKHQHKFDEHPLKYARNEVVGLPKDAGMIGNSGKVRNGEINASKRILSKRILTLIDKKWREVVMRSTGYRTYEDFRRGINKELGREFT